MKARGRFELTTKELPEELQFRIDAEKSQIFQVALAAFAFLFMARILVPLFAVDKPLFYIMLAIAIVGIFWIGITVAKNWNRVYTTTLSVTGQRLEATGDLLVPDWYGRYVRPGKIVVPVSEIKSIGYSIGGKYSHSGFWATCGFMTSSCLLPGLSPEQCTSITVAIARRFPQIGAKKQPKV
jgi:hypothetical protein